MMDSPKITYKYYSNPAFCAQSEVVYTQQAPCVSPRITTSPQSKSTSSEQKRMPPLGANSPKKKLHSQDHRAKNQRVKTDISDNPLRNVYSKNDGSMKYFNTSQNTLELPPKPGPKPRQVLLRLNSQRNKNNMSKDQSTKKIISNNSYVHGEELEMYKVTQTTSEDGTDSNAEEETVICNRILKHRYAEIPDDYDDYSPSKKRIIETEPEEYNVDNDSEEDAKNVPKEIIASVNGKVHRYAIIPSEEEEEEQEEDENPIQVKPNSPPTFHLTSPGMPRKQLEATQKLHELLATPRKKTLKIVSCSPLKSCTSSPSLRTQSNSQNSRTPTGYATSIMVTPSKPIISSTPKQTLNTSKSCANLTSPPLPRRNSNFNSTISPKAQQRLHYGIPNEISPQKYGPPNFYARERSFDRSRDTNKSFDLEANQDKHEMFAARSTAIISPRMISRGSSSIYSDGTVFSNIGWKATPGCATLILAAAMLALCGGLTAALSFYMMHTIGRQYYLDVSVMSGFTCFILGLLGFRTQTEKLLPNRNYISGYIIISIFSLLTCGVLLTLLCTGAEWSAALREMVGGAVTTMGALCLLLATIGAVSSCCCGYPPPDNRVANAART